MKKIDLNRSPSFDEEEINFQELLYILLKEKKSIIIFTTFLSISALIYSFSLPNIYESKALLNPMQQQDNISSTLESLGGLASIAGIGIPGINQESNAQKAKEKLNSLSFFENEIMPSIFLPNLMALDYWDHYTNKIFYDDDIYNQNSDLWVRDFSYPQKQIPSPQESFEVFHKDHLKISEDKQTGFITIAVKHESPYIANQWTELIVSKINAFYRDKDKREAEKAILFLNSQLNKTSLSEIKLALVELLQVEIKKLTLVEAKELYVFDYIDPSVVMEEKESPNRIMIVFLGAIIGAFIGILFVLIRQINLKNTELENL